MGLPRAHLRAINAVSVLRHAGPVEWHLVRHADGCGSFGAGGWQRRVSQDAVKQLIDDKKLPRKPMLGTIVDPTK
jgi:hypothetical protein